MKQLQGLAIDIAKARNAIVGVALLLSTVMAFGQASSGGPDKPVHAVSETLQLGPVYTYEKTAPAFPKLKVVFTAPLPSASLPAPRDLTLVEDGVSTGPALSVEHFGDSGYGVAAVVAIDVSGSMAGVPLKIIRDSLYKFVSDARSQDSVGVLTIADDAKWDVRFGSDHETLQSRLQSMHPRGHNTLLYDGILVALESFDSSLPLRRELTVISDGHDEGSHAQLAEVVQMARDRGIAIDAIGLTRSSPQYLQSLRTMASETGGSFHRVVSDEELHGLISQGMDNLKASPIATFQASRIEPDGKRHRLGVRWDKLSQSGETHFQTPFSSAGRWIGLLKHPPRWAYPALTIVCLGIILLVVLVIRHFLKQPAPAAPSQFHLTPSQFYDPEPPLRAFSGPMAPPPHSVTPAMASITPFEQKPAASVNAQPVSDRKKTRIAGLFDDSGPLLTQLTAISGPLEGRVFPITRENFWIGAAPENQLVMADDATVSGRHAYLFFEGPILILADNQSTNGTGINGQVVRGQRRPLMLGDRVQIGRTVFRLDSSR